MRKSFDFENARVVYEDAGDGMPLMLIHGFAEDSWIWSAFTNKLKDQYRVIVPDLPGSGESGLHTPLSISSMADAMAALLKSEKISEAVIIGHSMGGYIALALAEKYPDMIHALGLFHSTAFADSEEKKNSRRKNIKFIQSHGSADFIKQSLPALFSEGFKSRHEKAVTDLIDMYKKFNPKALVAYYEAMIDRPDRTEVLKTIQKPVLLIIGKHDTAIAFDDSLKLCHLPSLSYIHILENSGHMGMLEEPALSYEIVDNFLENISIKQDNGEVSEKRTL
jgi:pimeloyl-ACP methyl ester carboxylesterase